MTRVSWAAHGELDLEDWIHQGQRFGTMGRATGWWIGDWLNYGNAIYGERYTRAARITGYDVQTLRNMAYVASRFEVSRRRENLSWSHHAELAALAPSEQERWLTLAEQRRLPKRCLRAELRAARTTRGSQLDHDAGASNAGLAERSQSPPPAVVCPACGHHIVLRAPPDSDLSSDRVVTDPR